MHHPRSHSRETSALSGQDPQRPVLARAGNSNRSFWSLIALAVVGALLGANRSQSQEQPQSPAADWSPSAWTWEDIGRPAQGGTFNNEAGRVQITGGGAGISGSTDQFHFGYQKFEGDFDVRARVVSLDRPDVWARAGLMARQTTAPDSPYSAALATPSISGILYQSRAFTRGVTASRGSFPVNYPHTWLRLRRSGPIFFGYASLDGANWNLLGTNIVENAGSFLVGLAVSGNQSNQIARAVFENLGPVLDGNISASRPQALPIEPLGPSSRRTGLVFSEIMYHPADRTDGRDLEFIEILNTQPFPEDLSEYRLGGSIDYTFPKGQTIGAGDYLVIAKAPADLQAVHGIAGALGGFTNNLPNNSGAVRLLNRRGAVLLEVEYGSRHPWPAAADGGGCSLVLHRPSHGENQARAWAHSGRIGGSPGTGEALWPVSWMGARINEVINRPVAGREEAVELFNASPREADLSGCILTDRPGEARYRFPGGARLAPGSFLSRTRSTLGFGLRGEGEIVFLISADGQHILDAAAFPATPSGTSFGRSPDGAPDLRVLHEQTPGAANSSPYRPEIIINEIQFNPLSGDASDEFIELFNRGKGPVSLAGWRLSGGIQFLFPANTVMPAGGYLAVARNRDRLATNYARLGPVNLAGNFEGALANGGERLALSRPDPAARNNPLGAEPLFVVVDEVTYGDSGRWSEWADGGGSSLELMDPNSDNDRAANWADSNEEGKAAWVAVEHTGVLDNGTLNPDSLHVFLQGAGECLIDAVEVLDASGRNLVANSGFETGTAGWTFQGNHDRSRIESSEGYNSGTSLRVIATGRGDPGANRIRIALSPRPAVGSALTLRARARWLRGHPELLLRLHGNYLEAFGRIGPASGLGTPGFRNSRWQANAGPAIWDVAHAPVLPPANVPIVVTARAADSDGVQQVVCVYRIDPSAETMTEPMRDDGGGGDAVAGDGIYSAALPGQNPGTVLAFYVEASDSAGVPRAAKFPPLAPARECLVRFGEILPHGNLGAYRMWYTRATGAAWSSRLKLHNGALDATFVYGNHRAVYNIGTLYSGSPFVSPGYDGPTGSTLCGYVMEFPKDDSFLGATDFVLDWPIRDDTLVLEQAAYWIAAQMDLPYNHRRFIHLYVNGSKRGRIYEDVQQPNADVIDQFYPEDNAGDLYKIEDWFEFGSFPANMEMNQDATLEDFTTTGGEKKLARYRWNWRKRAVRDSANDYRSLFSLVDAVNEPNAAAYVSEVDSLVDVQEWMGIFAVERIVGNWDSFGYSRGKNMYAYKPASGKWQLLMWDIDFVMSAAGNPPGSGMFGSIDPAVSRMMFTPPFSRVYYRAMQRALDGPLNPSRINAELDARRNGLLANGITGASVTAAKNYITSRRANLREELGAVAAPFAITTNNGQDFSSNENVVQLRGTAPGGAATIWVNGNSYPVDWESLTQWSMRVPLSAVTNVLQVQAHDARGALLSGARDSVTVRLTGALDAAEDFLAIHEIMFHPAIPGGEFVELHNASARTGFDLSGVRVEGLEYVFPSGSLILPGAYLILVKDKAVFESIYGSEPKPAGVFSGQLSRVGETLRLIKPGANPAQNQVLDQVTYSPLAPWPALALGTGSSLQLRDARQDNDRVGNWASVPPTIFEPQWKFISVTGTASTNLLLIHFDNFPPAPPSSGMEGKWIGAIKFGFDSFPLDLEFKRGSEPGTDWTGSLFIEGQVVPLSEIRVSLGGVSFSFAGQEQIVRFSGSFSADFTSITGTFEQQIPGQQKFSAPFNLARKIAGGETHVDDVWLTRGAQAATGENLARNGDFEQADLAPWNLAASLQESRVTADRARGGSRSLFLASKSGGFNQATSLWQETLPITPGEQYTLSFWYLPGDIGSGLTVRLAGVGDLAVTADIAPFKPPRTEATPGAANSSLTVLAPFPDARLNEIHPQNLTGPSNASGQRQPWVELFNAGTQPLSLDGFHLSPSQTNLAAWRFPEGITLAPGGFLLVWLDGSGAPASGAGSELRANFHPAPETGLLLLTRVTDTETTVIDFLRYTGVPADRSFGRLANGTPGSEQVLPTPSPAATNPALPLAQKVFINEWMASNTGFISDPASTAGGEFDDWLELFNPNDTPADLGGYTLTDNQNARSKWIFPAGTQIPARGFLLVWADEQTSQNGLTADLHANFKLSQAGEFIGLYAPDGALVDQIAFGPQTANRSEGRLTDGAAAPFVTFGLPTPRTSNAGSETPPAPPIIFEAALLDNGSFRLFWSAEPGRTYQVQSSATVEGLVWTDLGDPVKAITGYATQDVPSPSLGVPLFYRVRTVE